MTELEKLAAAVRGKLVGKANASARQYSLRQGEDGKMTCTCGDYKFRQGAVGGECKHIKAHKGTKPDGVPFLREAVKQAALPDLTHYFETSRGSQYIRDTAARLQRWKSFHQNTGGKDMGLHGWRSNALFIPPTKDLMTAHAVTEAYARPGGPKMRFMRAPNGEVGGHVLENGIWVPMTREHVFPRHAKANPSTARELVTFPATKEPQKDHFVLDFDQAPGAPVKGMHLGNKITRLESGDALRGVDLSNFMKEGAAAALEKFAGRASQQAIAALEQSLGKPLSKYTGSRGPGDVVPALNRATRLRHIGDPRATAALAHPAVSRAYGPDVGSLPGGASPVADATDAIYGHRLSIAREPGADIPHSLELSQRLQDHAHSKQVEKRWPAWRQSVPFIGDGGKEGAEAALEKFAIEYKSPKMQQVLQGAMDKAYEGGFIGRFPREILAPGRRPDRALIRKQWNDGNSRAQAEKRAPNTDRFDPSDNSPAATTRQVIFGSTPKQLMAGPRAIPYAFKMRGLNADIAYLRGADFAGTSSDRVGRKINDPRIQRVIEHRAPGGVERIRQHLLRVTEDGPTPAFNAQKLKPPEGR